MKVKVLTVTRLLEKLLEVYGYARDFTGLRQLSEKLEFQNSHYFYKKVHQEILKKRENAEVGLSRFHMNKSAMHLGFSSFEEFEASLTGKISSQLASLVGSYYCYVRANKKEGFVMRSPVRIWKKENKVWYELKGPSATFKGELVLKQSSLFVLMQSPEGKSFYHVYKIGNRSSPKVLQGVFSGVSTAFDPIGGRTVLIRQESDPSDLTNRITKASLMQKSKSEEERVLSSYFKVYTNNNVAPFRSASFSLMDLK